MDDSGRLIPIVEDDQGEGWKDPLDNEEAQERWNKDLEKLERKLTQEKHSKRFKK